MHHDRHLVDWHVGRHLANRHLANKLLACKNVTDRHLANRYSAVTKSILLYCVVRGSKGFRSKDVAPH